MTNTRIRMTEQLREAAKRKEGGGESLELCEEELRLILFLRAVGFGHVNIWVNKGKPVKCEQAVAQMDFTKPIDFD